MGGSQPELSHCSRQENDRNSSLKRRARGNEALCASLSPAQRPVQGMLYFKVPSTGGRGICWMPTKLPVSMRSLQLCRHKQLHLQPGQRHFLPGLNINHKDLQRVLPRVGSRCSEEGNCRKPGKSSSTCLGCWGHPHCTCTCSC